MKPTPVNEASALERAREIARRTLSGDLDPLLACRDVVALRARLAGVPEKVMNTFIAVASEVDDLPLGSDRRNYAPDTLSVRDAEAADYRARVKDVVLAAMAELMVAVDH